MSRLCGGAGRSIRRWVCAAAFLVPAAAALAATAGVYEAEVPIEGQSPEQRNQAIQEAFRVVLIRLLGAEDALAQPGVEETIKSSPRLVRQYRYRWDESAADGPRQTLAVQFDEAAVNRALRDKKVGPPGDTRAPAPPAPPAAPAAAPAAASAGRSTLLLWLASDRSGQRDFVTPETDPRLLAAANGAAREHGVPILFPLYDLEDRSSVSVADLWGGSVSNIEAASRRYAADRILVGLVSGGDTSGWSGRWTLLGQEGVVADWTTRGGSSEAAVQSGIVEVANRAAGRPPSGEPPAAIPPPSELPAPTPPSAAAPEAGPGGSGAFGPAGDLLPVRVAGIQRLEDFVRAERHLSGLAGVTQVRVLGVSGDAVVFGLAPPSADNVMRAAVSGSVLAADSGAQGNPGADPRMLRLRLLP